MTGKNKTNIPKFEALMDLYYSGLVRVAASYEANPALQEELTQDVLEAIWRSLKNFRGDSSIKTYLYRIAHFRGARHVSKQIKRIEVNSEQAIEDVDYQYPELQVEKQQQFDSLLSAIHQLPIIQRQLITLFLDGFSYQEMAEITGLNTNHIGVNLNRAKSNLKQFLELKDA